MRPLFLLVVLVLTLLACGGDRNPFGPTPAPAVSMASLVLSGTVRDPEGIPVAGAQVGTMISKTNSRQTTTDDAGAYRLTVTMGSHRFDVSKSGFRHVTQTVSIADHTVLDVTLVPGVLVTGRISEAGVGPLDGATVEVMSGPHAGTRTTSGRAVPGTYSLGWVTPGTFVVRASKTGYDTIEQTVDASANVSLDFTLKWSYGSCLRSVAPVSFSRYSSQGGTEQVTVDAHAARTWTATADSPWLEVVSPASQIGPGQLTFRVMPNPQGTPSPRTGAVMIRCGAAEGQNVWIAQNAGCQLRLTAAPDAPAVFPPDGGLLRLHVRSDTRGCPWHTRSEVGWIHPVGIRNGAGDFDVSFVVHSNPTGHERSGRVVVGETPWTVTQF